MARNKKQTTVYLEPTQLVKLKALQERTRVPMAVHIRDAIDEHLKRDAAEQRARAEVEKRNSLLRAAGGRR